MESKLFYVTYTATTTYSFNELQGAVTVEASSYAEARKRARRVVKAHVWGVKRVYIESTHKQGGGRR